MLVIGIDENGLGPALGPLIVTACVFEAPEYNQTDFWKLAGNSLKADDSKKIFGKTKMADAEYYTLGWLKKFGVNSHTHIELFSEIVKPLGTLPCGKIKPGICKMPETALPVWNKKIPKEQKPENKISDKIIPRSVSAFSICPGLFNQKLKDKNLNKLKLDFGLMLEHIFLESINYKGEVLALCGKVGSTKKYSSWITYFCDYLFSALCEISEISTYRFINKTTLSLIRDGDSKHLPIAVASMIGKYLRELEMLHLNNTLGKNFKRHASGYRDKVTKEFIKSTKPYRDKIELPEECFLRYS